MGTLISKSRKALLLKRKRVTVIDTINGQSFCSLFPDKRNQFDDFSEAVKSVAGWMRKDGVVPSFSLKTKRMHTSYVETRA